MASLFTPPFLDVGAGITPADGALLNFYVVGSGTRKDTFPTAAATAGTEHANPVVADALGVFPAIYTDGDYDWVLTDKGGVQKNTGDVGFISTSGIIHSQFGSLFNLETLLQSVREVNVRLYGAVGDGSTNDYPAILLAITAAKDNGCKRVYFPGGLVSGSQTGNYRTFTEIVMDSEGMVFVGDSMATSLITQPASGFTGDATINVTSGRMQGLQDIGVYALNGGTKDALRITNGQYFHLNNVLVKNGVYGIRYIKGNAQRWWNVLVESSDTGIGVIPDSGDDTNGGSFMGIRTYNCQTFGLDIQQGAGATGSMHGMWNISCEEGADAGIRVRGGRYNWMHLYTEQNVGTDFDLDDEAANYYFLANPDNGVDGALFETSFRGAGVYSTGTRLITDLGTYQGRIFTKDFATSGTLAAVGVDITDITNSSGGTLGLTLTFISSMRVGKSVKIVKSDATAGFTLTSAGSVVLEGDTGTFGANPKGTAVLEITKYSDTQAICVQYDRASYDTAPVGKTDANLNDRTNNINTTDKVAGLMVFNSTGGYIVYASGGSDSAIWKKVSDDTTSNTPIYSGSHTGADNAAVLTDSTQAWTVDELIGLTITNTTNSGTSTVTSNTATTVTGVLSGGNDWDTGNTYTIA